MSSIAEIKERLKTKPCGFCMNDFDLTGEIPDACRECHAPPQDNIEDDYHRGWLPNRDADAIAFLLSEVERLKIVIENHEKFIKNKLEPQ